MRHEDALCSPRGEGLASRRRPNGCSSHAHVYFVCFMHGTPASKEFEIPECQSRTCILTFVHTTVFFLKCPSVGWASIFLLATRLQFSGSQLNSEYHAPKNVVNFEGSFAGARGLENALVSVLNDLSLWLFSTNRLQVRKLLEDWGVWVTACWELDVSCKWLKWGCVLLNLEEHKLMKTYRTVCKQCM